MLEIKVKIGDPVRIHYTNGNLQGEGKIVAMSTEWCVVQLTPEWAGETWSEMAVRWNQVSVPTQVAPEAPASGISDIVLLRIPGKCPSQG